MNLRPPVTLGNIRNGAFEFMSGKTWVPPLKSRFCLVQKPSYKYFRVIGRHLEFLALVTSSNIRNGTSEFMSSETLDRAVEITFLSNLEAEI